MNLIITTGKATDLYTQFCKTIHLYALLQKTRGEKGLDGANDQASLLLRLDALRMEARPTDSSMRSRQGFHGAARQG
jgi:hypothetical protein